MSIPIADYGLIGNLRSAALVSRGGSLDWFCAPHFDSPACFAALLGSAEHGRWWVGPTDREATVTRRYRGNTLILENRFETENGALQLTDFMPLYSGCFVMRLLECTRGELEVGMDCRPRFDYGHSSPHVSIEDRIVLRSGTEAVVLRSDHPGECELLKAQHAVSARWRMAEGDRCWLSLEHVDTRFQHSTFLEPFRACRHCEEWWENWAARCAYRGPHRAAVLRSLITIKALTHAPSGGMVAAPTSSLPEYLGGSANWDYRFCWLRDAALALDVLLACEYIDEVHHWRNWLQRAAATHSGPLRPLYTVEGKLAGAETMLDWLPGYENSRPVRTGNAASRQFQLDLFGELMDVLHMARVSGVAVRADLWDLQCRVLTDLAERWREPDAGIWEFRSDEAQLTFSKVMAWVAFDRSICDAERHGLKGPLDHWRATRNEIRKEILHRGMDPTGSYFVERYDSDTVDASLLMIPLVNFLPANDPRVANTVIQVEKRLQHNGLVYRHKAQDESWYNKEGAFLLCSFWLVDNYYLMGRREEAEALFEKLMNLRNDLGLLAEEYDPNRGIFLGNFPLALTHLGLVNSARLLSGESVMRCG